MNIKKPLKLQEKAQKKTFETKTAILPTAGGQLSTIINSTTVENCIRRMFLFSQQKHNNGQNLCYHVAMLLTSLPSHHLIFVSSEAFISKQTLDDNSCEVCGFLLIAKDYITKFYLTTDR